MKKTMLSLTMLALCSSVLAGPIEDKVNSYNAIRAAKKLNAPMLDVKSLLRNEAGVTSAGNGNNTCVTCSLGSTVPDRQSSGGQLPISNPTANSNTGNTGNSLMSNTPAGLGVIAPFAERSPSGSGADWLPPTQGDEAGRWANYEAAYQTHIVQYKMQLGQIRGTYLDPNGKLAQARIDVLNAVEPEMNAWSQSTPQASASQRAQYESIRIAANSGRIQDLVGQYNIEMANAKMQFNMQMDWFKNYTLTPPVSNNDGGGR